MRQDAAGIRVPVGQEAGIRRARYIAIGLFLLTLPLLTSRCEAEMNQHPRIWLTPAMLAELKKKAAENTAEWRSIKARTDQFLRNPVFSIRIVNARNTSPVELITADPLPAWSGAQQFYFGGATGAWAAINTLNTARALMVRRTGERSMTVYLDSAATQPLDGTAFGPFEGQRVIVLARTLSARDTIIYPYQGSGWYSALLHLSLAYQVTGDPAYADKALEVMDHINSYTDFQVAAPIMIDSGYGSRYMALGLAIAYDWLYDLLSPERKRATHATLNYWFDFYKCDQNKYTPPLAACAGNRTNSPYINFWGGHLLGFGAAGYATYGDNPRGEEIVNHVRREWDNNIPNAFTGPAGGFSGGQAPESWNYGPNHLLRIFQFAHLVKTATNEEILGPGMSYAKRVALHHVHALKPNRWRVVAEGTQAGTCGQLMGQELPVFLTHILEGTPEAGWMQYLFHHMEPYPACQTDAHGFALSDLSRFLWYRPARPEINYAASEPKARFFEGDGHLYWRSSWEKDAVWLSFTMGRRWLADHQGTTFGHIDIQRGNDNLAVQAGYWKGVTGSLSGITGNPQAYSPATEMSNVLFVDDGGEYNLTTWAYAGGGGRWGSWKNPLVKITDQFAYGSQDFTDVWDRSTNNRRPLLRTVRYYFRSLAAIGDGTIVVWDQARTLKESHIKRLHWHMNPAEHAPQLEGSTVSSQVGGSKLFIRPVLPAVSAIRLSRSLSNGTPRQDMTWRAEISDPAGGTDLNMLTVLHATSASGRMPETRALTQIDAKHAGVLILDAAPTVAVFSRSIVETSGYPGYQVEQASSVTLSAEFPGRGRYLIANLRPGRYQATLNGNVIVSPVVGADGVAWFEAGSGRLEVQFTEAIADHPVVASLQPPKGQIDQRYEFRLEAAGGTPPYRWEVASGTLPPGLALSPEGLVSGLPRQAGAAIVSLRVTDSQNLSGEASLAFEIADGAIPPWDLTIRIQDVTPHGATLRLSGTLTPLSSDACLVQVARDPAYEDVIFWSELSGGEEERSVTVEPLESATPYFVRAQCGMLYGTAEFSTLEDGS